MNTISFMTANFVARELHYRMARGRMEGDDAANAWFQPEKTFAERFNAMLAGVAAVGFDALDLWLAHLNPKWASPSQIATAAQLLRSRNLRVVSLAGYLPDNTEDLARLAAVAHGLGCRMLGTGCSPQMLVEKRDLLISFLEENDLVYAYENHAEKTPGELLETVGDDAGGRIGIALDTGWFGTQGYPADEALRLLAPRLKHVHLKDIHPPAKGPGPTLREMGHETCALGDGVVPVESCVRVLRGLDYQGALSIEHVPEDHSPMEEVSISLTRLRGWLP